MQVYVIVLPFPLCSFILNTLIKQQRFYFDETMRKKIQKSIRLKMTCKAAHLRYVNKDRRKAASQIWFTNLIQVTFFVRNANLWWDNLKSMKTLITSHFKWSSCKIFAINKIKAIISHINSKFLYLINFWKFLLWSRH